MLVCNEIVSVALLPLRSIAEWKKGLLIFLKRPCSRLLTHVAARVRAGHIFTVSLFLYFGTSFRLLWNLINLLFFDL